MTGRAIGGLVVALLFAAPLFVGLRNADLGNDEAIYSYAVDRMLTTGEWLTPRSIPTDGPFLEKPPLKFWMIAGAIRAGLLPQDEFGYRFLDALMGAVAFIYIYVLGLRFGGVVAGFVAVLATFSMPALLFEHGLRTNNMEAPLVLAYCGGMYHFARAVDEGRATHIVAVSLYFVLGFMTKFVAALFLPFVCVLAAVTIPAVRAHVRVAWRRWIAAVVVAAVLISPWFVYEAIQFGDGFWRVILGEHVYTRLTSSLDPTHLQPWYFYFSRSWIDLHFGPPRTLDVIAAAVLFAGAWRARPWELRLLLLWWLVPFIAISAGTSKLFHYAYPFMPPLALGLGWIAARLARLLLDRWAPKIADAAVARVRSRGKRVLLTTMGVVALALAAVTIVTGPFVWHVAGVKVLQNSSVVRPVLVGVLTLGLARADAASIRIIIAAIALLLLPVADYRYTLSRLGIIEHARRSVADCVRSDHGVPRDALVPVYDASAARPNHADYYYLSRIGPWTDTEPPAGTPHFVRILREDYAARTPGGTAVAVDTTTIVVFPAAYATCADRAIEAGGKAVS